jgi:hypothetical protein
MPDACSSCLPCPAGFSTPEPGNSSGAVSCTAACAPGYVGRDGFAPCSACAAGTFSPRYGGELCELCRPASFSIRGQAECRDCPGGCSHFTCFARTKVQILTLDVCVSETCELALMSSQDEATVAMRTQCCSVFA